MRWDMGEYPKPWRWRFAVFPTTVGNQIVWLEWYQFQRVSAWQYNKRFTEDGPVCRYTEGWL